MNRALFILNGPNLNLLGSREPQIYGTDTLADIEDRCAARALELEVALTFRQSNHEGHLVDWIHEAREMGAAIVINAGAYTHSSIAIHDALKACERPVIELHLSNPHAREAFRHRSFVAPVATGVIAGFGAHGYIMAIDAAAHLIGDA